MDRLSECEENAPPVTYHNEGSRAEPEIPTEPQDTEYAEPASSIPMYKLCRLCGTSESVHNHIFDPNDDLNTKIANIQIQVSLDDRLPKRVCDGCRNQVLTLHGFCNEARLVQQRLIAMLDGAEDNKEVQNIPPPLQDMPPPPHHILPPLQDMPPSFDHPLLPIPPHFLRPPGFLQDAMTQTECHIEISPDIDLGLGLYQFKQELDCPFDEGCVAINPWELYPPDAPPDPDVKIETAQRKASQPPMASAFLQEWTKQRPDLQIKVKSEQAPEPWSAAYQGVPEHVDVKALKTDPDSVSEQEKDKTAAIKNSGLKNLRSNVTIKRIKANSGQSDDANGVLQPKIEMADPDSDSGLVNLEDYMKTLPESAKVKTEMFTCCVCSKTLPDRETCLEHYKVHSEAGDPEPPPPPPLPATGRCPRCRKSLAEDTWSEHWRRHWQRDRPAHRCTLCPAELCFRKIREIVEHGISYHARENDGHCSAKYKCDLCTVKFLQMKAYRHHRMIKHPDAGPPKPHCARCNYKSTSIVTLRNHVKLKHDANPHLCPQCGKTFGHSHHLKRHLMLHTGEKPFKCRFCGKGFASPSYLPDHERVHTGEKPFICGECGRAFSQRSSMVTHARSVHSHERPFVCQLCGRGFAAKGFLTTHLKTACI